MCCELPPVARAVCVKTMTSPWLPEVAKPIASHTLNRQLQRVNGIPLLPEMLILREAAQLLVIRGLRLDTFWCF